MTRLEKFLINRGLLETFKNNLRIYSVNFSTLNKLLKYENRKDFIFKSFMWSSTSEGFLFWENINIEWHECLKGNIL